MTGTLEHAREHYRRQQWSDAYDDLRAARAEGALAVDDLERLATAAYLLGHDAESAEAWADAHHDCLRGGQLARGVRCAFWLAFGHINRGEMAQAGGWLARAEGLLEECGPDCVERGYVLVPVALRTLSEGDPKAAHAMFSEVAAVADRFSDNDLRTFGRLGRGQALHALGDVQAATALLDEVMVGVTTDKVSPPIVGLAYCAVIAACHDMLDVRRAREWTGALTRWCDSQPDLVPYRGQCLVHRSEVMQLHGDWHDAIAEAERAVQWLSQPTPQPSVGAAWYQQAELHRLRGELTEAEEAYRSASHWGHGVQPGLALLRLAQGQLEAAQASARRVLDESDDGLGRSKVLPAYVEIMLAADDLPAARAAADDLVALAAGHDVPLLAALAAHAQGAVLLAEGEPRSALSALRRAWGGWQDLRAPYEGARARVLIGLAYGMLGDGDSADMELDAARWVFQELAAAPDLARLDALAGGGSRGAGPGSLAGAGGGHGLTGREIEVLVQLATGKTNRAIAAELFISEKTVARHVSNIFTKLGLSSRAAATAYAYEHDLA
jgi:ATP/maltotriose-dependent transcriptional regulator MalT